MAKSKILKDVWLGNCPLKTQFPNLFAMSNQQGCSVTLFLGSREIYLTFRRNLQERDVEWEKLTKLLSVITLSEEPDLARWTLEKDGIFST